MNPLKRLGNHRLYTQQIRALRSPVTRRTRAVLLTAEHHQRDTCGLIVLARIKHERLRATFLGEVPGVATGNIHQLVLQPNVSERAPHHDLMVAAPGAQRVVVFAGHTVGIEVLGGRGARFDGGCGGNVVGGD